MSSQNTARQVSQRLAALMAVSLMAGVTSAGASTTSQASAPNPSEPTVELVVMTPRGFDEGALSAAAGTDVEIVSSLPQIDAIVVEVPASQAEGVRSALEARSDVEAAYRPSVVTRATNDPQWPRQRWMVPQGFEDAWSVTTGSNAVVVASIDSGVNETADLAGRVLPGWDYTRNRPGGKNADDDPGTHGTLTASLMAARGNDGVGIAGACWSCQVLPLKVLAADGRGYSDDVAAAIVYAVDAGAHVVNLSLGGASNDTIVANAVQYAEARGVVVVAAAGNDFLDPNFPSRPGVAAARYPAAYPTVVGVGSYVSDGGGPASFSQRGSQWFDLAAGACFLDGAGLDQCGTSFSAPYVAGTLALMRSQRGDVTPADLRAALYNSAVKDPSLTHGGAFRYGRLAAGAAVRSSAAIPVPDRTPPAVSLAVGASPVRDVMDVTIGSSDAGGVAQVAVHIGGIFVYALDNPGPTVQTSIALHSVPEGTHQVVATAIDRAGNQSTSVGTVTIDQTGPVAALFWPRTGSTIRRSLDIIAYSADPSEVVATFVLVNRQVVHGWLGDGASGVRVPIRRNGPMHVVAITVDKLGNISGSNSLHVNGRVR